MAVELLPEPAAPVVPFQLRQGAAILAGDVLTIRKILDCQLRADCRYAEALEHLGAGVRALVDLAAAIDRGEPARAPATGPVVFGDLDGGELRGRGGR